MLFAELYSNITRSKMAMSNNSLNLAKVAQNDEFYTLMEDIENEITQYDFSQFKNKVVYCNCDDPTWSNFYKFFVKWGHRLGIKEARFTNFANGVRQFKQGTLFENGDLADSLADDKKGTAHYWIYTPATNNVVRKELKGNGDFKSAECKKFLEQADIVVTNPPFSLFKPYVKQLIAYDKKFLIIGDINARTYKDFFELIMRNRVWCGYTKVKNFQTADGITTFGNKCWYTNLQTTIRITPLLLHQQDLFQFQKYDNYDAIEIPQIKLIPDNYFGVMGVPITFLEKYCPEQFEILGTVENLDLYKLKTKVYTAIECKNAYFAKFGKNGTYDLNASGVINQNGLLKKVFKRILIRRRGGQK